MYSSIPALDTTPFNSINSGIYLSPILPLPLREQIAEAARTGLNMTEAAPDDLADEPDLVQGLSNTASLTVSSPVVPTPAQAPVQSPVLPINAGLSGIDREAQKDAVVLSREKLIQKYGYTIADRAIELAKSQPLTAQQARVKWLRTKRVADQEYGKDLKAAGVKPMQHSLKDFVHVIYTQLELQLHGENPSANEVLNLAFPDDPKKAKRIGESTRMQRAQEAYDSPEVMNHTVEKAMLEHLGKCHMNLRTQTSQFSQSLHAGVVLFEGYTQGAKIDQLKAQVKEQGTRISTLEQKVECTKNREALADAGCTTSREKVQALRNEGKGPTEIADMLGMPVNTVKSILRRSKNG